MNLVLRAGVALPTMAGISFTGATSRLHEGYEGITDIYYYYYSYEGIADHMMITFIVPRYCDECNGALQYYPGTDEIGRANTTADYVEVNTSPPLLKRPAVSAERGEWFLYQSAYA